MGKAILNEVQELNALLSKAVYSAADKQKIKDALKTLGLDRKSETKFVLLRQERTPLVKRFANRPIEIVPNGRGDWIGGIELKMER